MTIAIILIGINLFVLTIFLSLIATDTNRTANKIAEMHTLMRYIATRHAEKEEAHNG